jgi:hypothetical protein
MYVNGNSRVGEGEVFATEKEYRQAKKIKDLKDALEMAKNLCDTIVGSPPETAIRGDIESRAFELGHHPCILNLYNNEDE